MTETATPHRAFTKTICAYWVLLLCSALSGCGSSSTSSTTSPNLELTAEDSAVDQQDVSAAQSKQVEETEGITVDELVNRVIKAYRETESYYDNARYHETFVERSEGFWREVPPHQVSVVFSRPNRLGIIRRIPNIDGGDELKIGLACDGEQLRAFISDLPGQILDLPAPKIVDRKTLKADPELAAALQPVPLENLFPQLDLLLGTEEVPARFFSEAEIAFLPSDSLDDHACYRLQLRRPSGNYVAWFDKQEYLLRKLEIPTDQVRNQTDPDGVLSRLKLWIEFTDARGDTKIAAKAFQMELPEEAEFVAKFDPSTRVEEAEPLELTASELSDDAEAVEVVEIEPEVMAEEAKVDDQEDKEELEIKPTADESANKQTEPESETESESETEAESEVEPAEMPADASSAKQELDGEADGKDESILGQDSQDRQD